MRISVKSATGLAPKRTPSRSSRPPLAGDGRGSGATPGLSQFSSSFLLSHVFPDLPPGWWQWVSWGSALVLAHGITFELYLVGVVQQPVAYGVGQGRVTDIGVPVPDGALAGNNGGARLIAVFHDLQPVPVLLVGWRGE